jgi:hypothetical protein
MSINLSVGFQIPTNVVEVGNEITSDQLAAITNATTPTSANPFLTLAGGTLTGSIAVGTMGFTTTISGPSINFDGGLIINQEESYIAGFNIDLPASGTISNVGSISFSDSTTQTTAAVPYNTKKAIANLCASCFGSAGTTFYFTNYVAQCVAQGSKFTMGSQYLLGLGTGSTPTYTFILTFAGPLIADTGISYTSASGHSVCYSADYGSTWTYSDLSF